MTLLHAFMLGQTTLAKTRVFVSCTEMSCARIPIIPYVTLVCERMRVKPEMDPNVFTIYDVQEAGKVDSSLETCLRSFVRYALMSCLDTRLRPFLR